MKNREKMNNKGFSLVELIIVIAIMVILVGVLAPVYTRYVESTRKSSDVSAIADIMNAMETVMIERSARQAAAPADIVVDLSATAVTIADTDVAAVVGTTYTLKGTWTGAAASHITAHWNGDRVEFSTETTGTAHVIAAYSSALGNKFTPATAPAP
ncbi:MAG: prepilin-type N-terminal cleavage/methylation domain-containing protein [bacterium]|nr:prepilin-type N-terminal cleavage/methylation domain-containing protein [bacterium]MCM1374368.1 prepilin-type N-terminal cleavage/methylation domain-containing protein [Muribaculum sp.]